MIVPSAARGVIGKDLRLRMRGWRWAGVTALYVTVLGLIAIGFLLRRYSPSPEAAAQAGVQLFQSLALLQLGLIAFVTPASMAGAISGERQHRTWDDILLSGISPLEIVWAKFLVGMWSNALLVLTSLPLYCLVFLFGGVGFGDAVRTFAVLGITVAVLGAIGLLVSALTARLVVSLMLTLFISMFLVLGLTVLTLWTQAGNAWGLIALAATPFQSTGLPVVLPPFAQADPVVALLSALPDGSGGTPLGPSGTIQHSFGLSWQLPLWGAFSVLGVVVTTALLLMTAGVVSRSGGGMVLRRWTLGSGGRP